MNLVHSMVNVVGNKYLQTYANNMTIKRQDLQIRQETNFKKIRRALQGTRLFKDLRLAHIHTYDQYVNHVPVFNYEQYEPYVEMLSSGHQNILFKDEAEYFGLSSGTSGKDSKRIPYNERMISIFLKAQKRVACRLSQLEPQINFLTAPRLTFGSDPYLYSENGFKFGYISGILSTRIPKSLSKNTFPSREILAISNWDQKIDLLIQDCLNHDIQVVSGIPTYLISIFEAVLKKTGKETINEIWPNLKGFIYAATPIKQYEERINRLIGHDINYYGVYAATEAAIGLPYDKYQNGRQRYFLNPDLLYSFTGTEDNSQAIGLHEIELGVPYYLNIGGPNGLIHYAMKDVIVFDEVNGDLVFEFVGRKNTGMNLAAEKVSNEEILDSFLKTKQRSNIDLRHFFLSPAETNGCTHYLWTLFASSHSEANQDLLAQILDEELQKLNLDYAYCRSVGVLGPTQVCIKTAESLQNYFEAHRNRGQFKMKTTFETAEEYLQFMKTHIEPPEARVSIH